MANPWSTFGNQAGPIPTGELDTNFGDVAAMGALPCTISGQNALTLNTIISGFTLATYFNYMTFAGIAVQSNTGPVTAAYGAASPLSVYKDSPAGPVALTGGEIIAGNAIWLTYDSALNSGAGGFHLNVTPTTLCLPLNGGTVSGDVAMNGLQIPTNPISQSTIVYVYSNAQSLTYPSLAPNAFNDQTLNIPNGVVTANVAFALGVPTIVSGISYDVFVPGGLVSSVYVTVRAFNYSAGTVTPAAGMYRVTAFGSSP